MAYNEKLAEKVQREMSRYADVTQRKMFGGLCFMIGGNMCCGVTNEDLMVRVGPDAYEKALGRKHARPMDFTGKPMKGFVFVSKEGWSKPASLRSWVDLGADHALGLPKK